MKKLLALMIAGVLVLSACSESDQKEVEKKAEETVEKGKEVAKDTKEKVEEKVEEVKKEDKVPVTIDQLPYEIKIDKKPDSAGSVYAHVTYKNNSKYPVVVYELKVNLKDQNEKSYYSTFETVMPGEKSPNFESFGPKTSKKEDIDFLELEYKIKDKEKAKYLLITYNYKLDEYDTLEMSE